MGGSSLWIGGGVDFAITKLAMIGSELVVSGMVTSGGSFMHPERAHGCVGVSHGRT